MTGLRLWFYAVWAIAGIGISPSSAQEPPFKLEWAQESSFLMTGVAGGLLGQHRLTSMKPVDPAELNSDELKPWDRFAAGWYNPKADKLSDIFGFGIGGSLIYVEAWATFSSGSAWIPLAEDALLLTEAIAWSAALNLNARAFRIHPRPLVYGSDAPASVRQAPEAAGSFYSGHASGAFLGAAFLSTVYPSRYPEFRYSGWLWAGSLTVASSVAAMRVLAGRHFPSDIMVGAGVGTLIGWGIPTLHRTSRPKVGLPSLQLWPQADGFAVQIIY